jgi:hypothetical protein
MKTIIKRKQKKMGDAYSYLSLMNEGRPDEYIRLYNDGKVIEDWRTIYLEGLTVPLSLYDIVEIRIGGSTIRFVTKEGKYFIVSRDKILYTELYPQTETGVIL